MIITIPFNPNTVRKKIKLLVEVTFDGDSFEVSPKLNMLLNQYGIYDLDKIVLFITNFFKNINLMPEDSEVTFLVPFLFVFTKRKKKTLIFILNPLTNKIFLEVCALSMLRAYFVEINKRNISFFRNFTSTEYKKLLALRVFLKSKFKRKKWIKKICRFSIRKRRRFLSIISLDSFNYWKFQKRYRIWSRLISQNEWKRLNYLFSSFNWIFFLVLFKLVLFKLVFFTYENYFYSDLKKTFYSSLSFLHVFKSLIWKKYKKLNLKKKNSEPIQFL